MNSYNYEVTYISLTVKLLEALQKPWRKIEMLNSIKNEAWNEIWNTLEYVNWF